jgi:phenylacetate-CoA ligase
MLIVKGVNIYPAALKSVVGEFEPKTTGALRILLDGPGPLVTPPLRIQVEYGNAEMDGEEKHTLANELSDTIRDRLRVNPSIELVPPYSLPRKSGKTSIIKIEQK